jgi:hypothetical protein
VLEEEAIVRSKLHRFGEWFSQRRKSTAARPKGQCRTGDCTTYRGTGTIRHSPRLVCRALGETFYKFAA